MKNMILIVFLLINLAGNAQKGPHHISLGLSNNGQISQAMNNYYFALYNSPTIQEYDRMEFKTNLTYSYMTEKQLEFGFAAGYGLRTDHFEGSGEEAIISQRYISAMPFVMKGWNFNKLQLSAGAGIPCYSISNYSENVKSVFGYSADIHMTGGGAIGISGLMRVKWNFTERFSLNGMVNYGVLYMDYGREQYFYNYDSQGNTTGIASSFHKQKKTLIPSPELSLSIGFRI